MSPCSTNYCLKQGKRVTKAKASGCELYIPSPSSPTSTTQDSKAAVPLTVTNVNHTSVLHTAASCIGRPVCACQCHALLSSPAAVSHCESQKDSGGWGCCKAPPSFWVAPSRMSHPNEAATLLQRVQQRPAAHSGTDMAALHKNSAGSSAAAAPTTKRTNKVTATIHTPRINGLGA